MKRSLRHAVMTVGVLGAWLVGCGSSKPGASTHRPAVPAALATAYLGQLAGAQARLSAAERSIPLRPASVTALGSAVNQLARAIGRLERELRQITPPGPISVQHAELIASVEHFRTALEKIAAEARGPANVATVGSRLVATTSSASSTLASEQSAIEHGLGR